MPYNLFQKSKSSRKEVFFPVDQRTIFRMGANFPAFSCLAFRFMIEYFYRMRERSLCMKKLVGVVTCVVLLTSMISVASADIFFDYTTSAISGFPTWSNLALQSNGKNWHFTWDDGTNIASNRRAVVRILTDEGNYASSLWVYSTRSTNYHAYNDSASYGKANTTPAGRLDDRDTGTLRVAGTFYD